MQALEATAPVQGGATTADNRIPVTLVTGFLGSGKSTFINRLLFENHGAKIVVIVNEFGEIPIDHFLIAQGKDTVIDLPNGCLCCTVRDDLTTTLFGLYAGRVNGSLPHFDRVVIETTGVAEPGPILRMLYLDEVAARRFRLSSVVTTVDAVHGLATLETELEAVDQIAAADLVFLTKCDLAESDRQEATLREIALINPDSPARRVWQGVFDTGVVLADAKREPPAPLAAIPHARDHHGHHDHGADCGDGHHHRFKSRSLTFERPIGWAAFARWIDALRRLEDRRILRVKGLVDIAEKAGMPLVFQAVQGVAHPPAFLERWPSEDRRTRLVFITRDMDDGALDDVLEQLAGILRAPSAAGHGGREG